MVRFTAPLGLGHIKEICELLGEFSFSYRRVPPLVIIVLKLYRLFNLTVLIRILFVWIDKKRAPGCC
jgi:hypothetical protein